MKLGGTLASLDEVAATRISVKMSGTVVNKIYVT